jgi:hypothetical protein
MFATDGGYSTTTTDSAMKESLKTTWEVGMESWNLIKYRSTEDSGRQMNYQGKGKLEISP